MTSPCYMSYVQVIAPPSKPQTPSIQKSGKDS